MLGRIKRALAGAFDENHPVPAHERRHLEVAVAVLLHEARRSDYEEGDRESAAAAQALVEMFGLEPNTANAVLVEGRAKAQQLTSFYAPLTVIKRDFSLPERIRLVECLWRITFADGRLNLYEDHYVRKIAHLLHVPNTDSMMARNRAREVLAGG